ncbi:biotin--[acetyl-CoA-carboxylase] ligase [Bacteroidales bacterium OttesenSCG-928-A17]|nr:biotin--[acetyl-CoA-carboxylase] ligase [Bacteroidales bacterium OttesenSCG-928-A17]
MIKNIIKIESCPSTNIYLKELAEKESPEEGTVVISSEQTSGRGQAGNSWESEAEKNITCSILLQPGFLPLNQFFLLSEVISLGIKDTLNKYTDAVSIKWPNDIYYQDKKICGILIENELMEQRFSRSIVGIGLNINQTEFISDAPNPTSLKQITGKEFDLEDLLIEMLNNCFFWYEKLRRNQTSEIEEAYFKALYRNDGVYFFKDSAGVFEAKIAKVGANGILHLLTKDNEIREYAFKEVKFAISVEDLS